MRSMLAAPLLFCRCGHYIDRHRGRGACGHVHAKNGNACPCERFELDPKSPDGEALARGAVRRVIGARDDRPSAPWVGARIPLEEAEYDDLLAHAIEEVWIDSEGYYHRSHIALRVFEFTRSRQRIVDYLEHVRGARGQKRLLPAALLHAARTAGGLDDGDPAVHQLGEPASDRPDDDPDVWASDAGGLLAPDDRSSARDQRGHRREAA